MVLTYVHCLPLAEVGHYQDVASQLPPPQQRRPSPTRAADTMLSDSDGDDPAFRLQPPTLHDDFPASQPSGMEQDPQLRQHQLQQQQGAAFYGEEAVPLMRRRTRGVGGGGGGRRGGGSVGSGKAAPAISRGPRCECLAANLWNAAAAPKSSALMKSDPWFMQQFVAHTSFLLRPNSYCLRATLTNLVSPQLVVHISPLPAPGDSDWLRKFIRQRSGRKRGRCEVLNHNDDLQPHKPSCLSINGPRRPKRVLGYRRSVGTSDAQQTRLMWQ